jgi:hypothetical protein
MNFKNDKANISKGNREMSAIQRELYLRIVDDNPSVVPIVYNIHNYKFSFEISRWLYENQITGKILLDFLKTKFENSILALVKFVVMKINKDKEIKPLYYKDYKV